MTFNKKPASPDLIAFGYNLKIARIRLGKSLRDVGAECRSSGTDIAKIERAHINITIEKAVNLATAVGEPLYKLFAYHPSAQQVEDLMADRDPRVTDLRVRHRHSAEQAAAKAARIGKKEP